MTITQDVFLPVVGSVIVALIAFISRWGWGKGISKIRGISVRSVRGNWDTTFWKDDGTVETEEANVNQILHWIWGTIHYKQKKKDYEFKGIMRDHILVATYEPKNKPFMLDRGAFTLKLNPGGDRLEGMYSWTDDETSDPKSGKYEWRKE